MKLWKYLLLNSKKKEDGFTIVLVLGFGLFMLAVGITSIKISSTSEVNSKVQEKTQQSLAAAELGLVRVKEFLGKDNLKVLATYPDCVGTRDSTTGLCPDADDTASWANPTATSAQATESDTAVCISTDDSGGVQGDLSDILALASSQTWQAVDANDPSKGEYRLISYEYNGNPEELPGIATLTVEGRTEQTTVAATNAAINTGVTRLQIEIPIRDNSTEIQTTIPALWINYDSTANLGSNQIWGSILVSDNGCTFGGAVPNNISEENNIVAESGGTLVSTPTSIPDAPELPEDRYLNYAYSYEFDSSTEFPRAGVDKVGPDGAYHYLVPTLSGSGSGTDILIAEGVRVILYVQGPIDLRGAAQATGSLSLDALQIYGNVNVATGEGRNGTDYKYGCDDNRESNGRTSSNSCPTKVIDIRGTAETTAFIHAPEASACVKGGGGPDDPSITGSLWVDSWSNGIDCSGTIGVPNTMVRFDSDLVPANSSSIAALGTPVTIQVPQLSPTSTWKRLPAN